MFKRLFFRNILNLMIIGVLLLFLEKDLTAQIIDTADYQVETIDGNVFIGKITNSDSLSYIINTGEYGLITVKLNRVSKVFKLSSRDLSIKSYWHENIQSARYFWAPNAYGLKKGEGYYQNYWVLFNQVSYGFTDYFSVGIRIIPLFIFAGSPTPVWITPKLSIPIVKNKLNLGVGGLFGAVLGEEAGFGIVYGTATYGPRDKNISIGMGWGFAGEEWASAPVINVSGIIRVGKKGSYIMTENYFIKFNQDEYLLLLSFGGRSLINALSIDYGLFLPLSNEFDSFVAIPWLGITVPFAKRNK